MNLFCKGQKALSLKGKSNIDKIFKKGKYKKNKKKKPETWQIDKELKKLVKQVGENMNTLYPKRKKAFIL